MGAQLTEQRAEGKDVGEAYRSAVAAAQAYYGHQEGYSGAINSKANGYVVVQLPPRMTYRKLQALLEDAGASEWVADLKESIAWRENVLAKNLCKRSERPAVRARLQADKKELRKTESAAKKHAAAVERAGFTDYRFAQLVETYNDKWGVPLAVELPTREARPSKRGQRVYVFFGYAPC